MAIIISILYFLIAVAIAVALVAVGSMVFSWVSANHDVIVKDIKIVAITLLFIGILIAVALSPAASRAEELPDGFYHKVVFIDEIEEEHEEEEVHLYVDDLNHIWSYWESIEEDFEDLDWEREALALLFIRENRLEAAIDLDCCVEKGRIVVLTMWECDEENPFDDEVVDVYYTSFITW